MTNGQQHIFSMYSFFYLIEIIFRGFEFDPVFSQGSGPNPHPVFFITNGCISSFFFRVGSGSRLTRPGSATLAPTGKDPDRIMTGARSCATTFPNQMILCKGPVSKAAAVSSWHRKCGRRVQQTRL